MKQVYAAIRGANCDRLDWLLDEQFFKCGTIPSESIKIYHMVNPAYGCFIRVLPKTPVGSGAYPQFSLVIMGYP